MRVIGTSNLALSASSQPIGEVAYCEKIVQDHYYLNILDIYVLAMTYGFRVLFVFYDGQGDLGLKTVGEVVQCLGMTPVNNRRPDLKDPKTIVLVLGRFDWKPGTMLQLNHFSPAWHEDQLSHSEFEEASAFLLNNLAVAKEHTGKKLVEANAAEFESDAERHMTMASLLQEFDILNSSETAFKSLLQAGVVIHPVAGKW